MARLGENTGPTIDGWHPPDELITSALPSGYRAPAWNPSGPSLDMGVGAEPPPTNFKMPGELIQLALPPPKPMTPYVPFSDVYAPVANAYRHGGSQDVNLADMNIANPAQPAIMEQQPTGAEMAAARAEIARIFQPRETPPTGTEMYGGPLENVSVPNIGNQRFAPRSQAEIDAAARHDVLLRNVGGKYEPPNAVVNDTALAEGVRRANAAIEDPWLSALGLVGINAQKVRELLDPNVRYASSAEFDRQIALVARARGISPNDPSLAGDRAQIARDLLHQETKDIRPTDAYGLGIGGPSIEDIAKAANPLYFVGPGEIGAVGKAGLRASRAAAASKFALDEGGALNAYALGLAVKRAGADAKAQIDRLRGALGDNAATIAHHPDVKKILKDALVAEGEAPTAQNMTQVVSQILAGDTKIGSTTADVSRVSEQAGTQAPDTFTPKSIETAYTPRGQAVQTQYDVVNAPDLVTSHDTALRPNQAFPPELQPRDRGRAASEQQITDITSGLQPERLGASATVGEGAPIVGAGNIVESGNARTIALKRLYEQEHATGETYRTWLLDNAGRFGLDPESIAGMKSPVLVRRRVGDMTPADRQAFVQQANEPAVAGYSATEQATTDAGKLTPDLVSAFNIGEGDITAASNRDFVRSFLDSVVSPAERGKYVDAQGALSQEGVTRIRNAIFQRAYGDAGALAKIAESTDSNVRNIANGMLGAAPKMAQVKAGIESGALFPGLDISGDVAAAMRKLSQLRDEGTSVSTFLAQQPMFGKELSSVGEDLLALMSENSRSPKKITEILNGYADNVTAAGNPSQAGLFGDVAAPQVTDLLERAVNPPKSMEELFAQINGDTKIGIAADTKSGITPEFAAKVAGGADQSRLAKDVRVADQAAQDAKQLSPSGDVALTGTSKARIAKQETQIRPSGAKTKPNGTHATPVANEGPRAGDTVVVNGRKGTIEEARGGPKVLVRWADDPQGNASFVKIRDITGQERPGFVKDPAMEAKLAQRSPDLTPAQVAEAKAPLKGEVIAKDNVVDRFGNKPASLTQEAYPGEWGFDAQGHPVDALGYRNDGTPGVFKPGTEPTKGPLAGRSTVDVGGSPATATGGRPPQEPPKPPTAQAAPPPEDLPLSAQPNDAASSLHLPGMEGELDLGKAIADLGTTLPKQRGTRGHKITAEAATKLLEQKKVSIDTLVGLDPGAIVNAENLTAYDRLVKGVIENVDSLVVGDASPDTLGDAIMRAGEARRKIRGLGEEPGRATEIQKTLQTINPDKSLATSQEGKIAEMLGLLDSAEAATEIGSAVKDALRGATAEERDRGLRNIALALADALDEQAALNELDAIARSRVPKTSKSVVRGVIRENVRGNLLSGMATATNLVGNTVKAFTLPVKFAGAAALESGRAGVGGALGKDVTRAVHWSSIGPASAAMAQGIPRGVKAGWDVAVRGKPIANRFADFEKELTPELLGRLTDKVGLGTKLGERIGGANLWGSRLAMGTDQIYKEMFRSFYETFVAHEGAAAKGLKDDAYDAFVAKKLAAPSARTQVRAMAFADRETWNTAPGAIAEYLLKGRDLPPPFGDTAFMLMPFIATHTNILNEGLNWSPVAIGRIAKEWRQLDPVARATRTSQAVLGTASLMVLGGTIIGTDNLTGSGPLDSGRNIDWRQDHQPYSIKIGDQWVDYTFLGPFAIPVMMMADYADAAKYDGHIPDEREIGPTVAHLAKSVWNQAGYFDQLQSFFSAITSGSTNEWSKVLANFARELTPQSAGATTIRNVTQGAAPSVDTSQDLPALTAERWRNFFPTDQTGTFQRPRTGLRAVSPIRTQQDTSTDSGAKPLWDITQLFRGGAPANAAPGATPKATPGGGRYIPPSRR